MRAIPGIRRLVPGRGAATLPFVTDLHPSFDASRGWKTFQTHAIASARASVIAHRPWHAGWEASTEEWVTYLERLDRETEIVLVNGSRCNSCQGAVGGFSAAGAEARLRAGLAGSLNAAGKPLVAMRCDGG